MGILDTQLNKVLDYLEKFYDQRHNQIFILTKT